MGDAASYQSNLESTLSDQPGVGPRSGRAIIAGVAREVIASHGDADQTVHPSNGSRLVAVTERPGAHQGKERKTVAAAHDYTRHQITAPAGVAEYWVIHGAGHAWVARSNRS
jgi:predicted esterase